MEKGRGPPRPIWPLLCLGLPFATSCQTFKSETVSATNDTFLFIQEKFFFEKLPTILYFAFETTVFCPFFPGWQFALLTECPETLYPDNFWATLTSRDFKGDYALFPLSRPKRELILLCGAVLHSCDVLYCDLINEKLLLDHNCKRMFQEFMIHTLTLRVSR